MKRIILWSLIGAVIGTVGWVGTDAYALSFMQSKTKVYVSTECVACVELMEEVGRRSDVLYLPVEDNNEGQVCAATVHALAEGGAVWLQWAPRDWVCSRLIAASQVGLQERSEEYAVPLVLDADGQEVGYGFTPETASAFGLSLGG